MAKQAPARFKLLSALTARFIAIGSSMKMPSLRRSSGTSARRAPPSRLDRAVATAGRSARQSCTRLCWRRTALCTARFCPRRPARRYPEFPLPQAQRRILQQRLIMQTAAQPATAPLRRAAGAAAGRYRSARGPASFRRSVRRSAAPSINQPPVAQHRQGVADRLQLMDTMRNKHHPDPLMLQTAYYPNRRSLSCDPTARWVHRGSKSGNGATGRGPTGFAVFRRACSCQWSAGRPAPRSSCASASRASCRTRDQRKVMPGSASCPA